MISKKLLNSYGFNHKSEYFEMILESKINGQMKQAKEQFKELSKNDMYDFMTYLKGTFTSDDVYNFFFRESFNK